MGGKSSREFVTKVVLFLFLVYNCNKINATTYLVGDQAGWNINADMESWPEGKTFYAGDVLEFRYQPVLFEEVLVTDEDGYLTCTSNKNTTRYGTGDDKLTLPYGHSYYISPVPEDCVIHRYRMTVFANKRPPV